MKNISRIVMLPAFLIFVVFSSAIAETAPSTNHAVGHFDSISWWLEYAVKQTALIADPNCRDDVYGFLCRTQATAGDIDGSITSATAITKREKRIYAYIATAKTCYKQANIPGYQKSMQHAKLSAFSDGRVESQIFMHSNMVTAYLDCNDVNGAKSYTEILNTNPEVIKGYHDAQSAYRKIASYYAWNGNIKDADLILNNNIKPTGKNAALLEIAETCVREGNITVAEQFAEHITQKDYKDRVCEKIGVALTDSDNIEKALAVAETITDSIHKSSVIAAVAKYQVKSNDIDLGKKTAEIITDRDQKIAVYTLIAEKQAEAGKIDAAVVTIETMVKMIEDAPRVADTSKFGTFDDSFKKGGVKFTYLYIAKAFARMGDVENYNKYAAKATEGVMEINGEPIWKGAVLARIVDAQLEADDIDGAKKTLKEIKEEYTRSNGLFHIVETLLKKGDMEGAITTSKEISDTMNKSFAYGQIASAFVKNGDLVNAMKILLQMGNSSREAEAYRRTAAAFVETGHAEELANWLSEIPSPQARAYTCIGAADGIMNKSKEKKTPGTFSSFQPTGG